MVFKLKKDKENKDKFNEEEIIKSEFRVRIFESQGGKKNGILIEIKEFLCGRFVDNDGTPWLFNKKTNFYELFPQIDNTNNVYLNYPIEELRTKLKEEKKKINNDSTDNKKTIEKEIRKIKRAIQTKEIKYFGNFLRIGKDGKKEYHFLRVGSEFLPLDFSPDTSLIYVPSIVKRKITTLGRSDREKIYSKSKTFQASKIQMIIMIFLAVFLAVNIYGAFKLFEAYDESEIARLQTQSLENVNQCSASISQVAKDLERISNNIDKQKIVIEGDVPQGLNNQK